MAPSALADIYPIPARHYHKPSTVVASVLHGPRDLRLVRLHLPLTIPHCPLIVGVLDKVNGGKYEANGLTGNSFHFRPQAE